MPPGRRSRPRARAAAANSRADSSSGGAAADGFVEGERAVPEPGRPLDAVGAVVENPAVNLSNLVGEEVE